MGSLQAVRRGLALVITATAFVAGGCGSEDDGGGDGGGQAGAAAGASVQKVTVGLVPGAQAIPVVLGVQRGIFKEENLEVETKFLADGAQAVPALLNGEIQVASVSTVSVLTASERKVPLKAVMPSSAGGKTPEDDWAAVLVSKDSPIKTVKDLEGKTIALNGLKNLGDVTVKASLAKQGVDVSTLKFVEVPFPEMNAALKRNRVDAVWVIEPFRTIGLAAGSRALVHTYAETMPTLPTATFMVSERYGKQNADVIARFRRAMSTSFEYASTHEPEVRKVLETEFETDPALAEKVNLAQWPSELDIPAIQELAKLSKQYGAVEGDVDVNSLVLEQE